MIAYVTHEKDQYTKVSLLPHTPLTSQLLSSRLKSCYHHGYNNCDNSAVCIERKSIHKVSWFIIILKQTISIHH